MYRKVLGSPHPLCPSQSPNGNILHHYNIKTSKLTLLQSSALTMVTSCITIVQYQNQKIDTVTIVKAYSHFTSFTYALCMCVFSMHLSFTTWYSTILSLQSSHNLPLYSHIHPLPNTSNFRQSLICSHLYNF